MPLLLIAAVGGGILAFFVTDAAEKTTSIFKWVAILGGLYMAAKWAKWI